MKVFVSHASTDTWIARQMARCIRECGADVIIDAYDLKTGDDMVPRLSEMLEQSTEPVVLFTPASRSRAWVWMEIGHMRFSRKRVVPIFHGMNAADLADTGGIGAVAALVPRQLNDFDLYLAELRERAGDAS